MFLITDSINIIKKAGRSQPSRVKRLWTVDSAGGVSYNTNNISILLESQDNKLEIFGFFLKMIIKVIQLLSLEVVVG